MDGLPQYDPEKFVDRKKEIKAVLERARLLLDESPVERRVVIFEGQRGAGKTWLLRRLADVVPQAALWGVYGADPPGPEARAMAHLIELLVCSDSNALNAALPPARPLVVLINDLNELDELTLDRLEERVLSPLAQDDQVLIVLAERGRPRAWKTPEFSQKAEYVDLGGFARPDVEAQLEKQVARARDRVAEILDLGGGYPLSNYVLGQHLPDRAAALDCCTEELLAGPALPLRSYFEALAVLRAFDESRMPAMLKAYPPTANKTWNLPASQKVKQQLLGTTLVRWDKTARGFVMAEPIQYVLRAWLQESQPDLWMKLHCAAFRLYKEWAAKYKQSSAWWRQEAAYHEKCLIDAKYRPADCPDNDRQGGESNGH